MRATGVPQQCHSRQGAEPTQSRSRCPFTVSSARCFIICYLRYYLLTYDHTRTRSDRRASQRVQLALRAGGTAPRPAHVSRAAASTSIASPCAKSSANFPVRLNRSNLSKSAGAQAGMRRWCMMAGRRLAR